MFLITKINNNDNLSRLSGSVGGGVVIAGPGVSQSPGSTWLEVLISSTGPGTGAVHVTLVRRGSGIGQISTQVKHLVDIVVQDLLNGEFICWLVCRLNGLFFCVCAINSHIDADLNC